MNVNYTSINLIFKIRFYVFSLGIQGSFHGQRWVWRKGFLYPELICIASNFTKFTDSSHHCSALICFLLYVIQFVVLPQSSSIIWLKIFLQGLCSRTPIVMNLSQHNIWPNLIRILLFWIFFPSLPQKRCH